MNTKKDIRNFILLVLFYICALMLSAFLAFGCSATRLHDKAVKKGYVHTIHVDTLKIPYVDTLVITKGDSIIYEQVIKYRDSLVFNTLIEYKPKWRTRFDNKRFADSLDNIRAMYKDSLKNALKTQKVTVKQEIKKDKQETKRTQSKNKNGFADSMKWIAVLVFLLIVALLLFKYAPKNPSGQ